MRMVHVKVKGMQRRGPYSKKNNHISYPVASIFKDVHFNSTSFLRSNLLRNMDSLKIFEGPSV